MSYQHKIIIEGFTEEGEVFRPSDWAERISDRLSTFHNHRIIYSPQLQPVMREGHKCVLFDLDLKKTNPMVYQDIMEFVRTNKLKTHNEPDNPNNLPKN